jgi:hypothetical protein
MKVKIEFEGRIFEAELTEVTDITDPVDPVDPPSNYDFILTDGEAVIMQSGKKYLIKDCTIENVSDCIQGMCDILHIQNVDLISPMSDQIRITEANEIIITNCNIVGTNPDWATVGAHPDGVQILGGLNGEYRDYNLISFENVVFKDLLGQGFFATSEGRIKKAIFKNCLLSAGFSYYMSDYCEEMIFENCTIPSIRVEKVKNATFRNCIVAWSNLPLDCVITSESNMTGDNYTGSSGQSLADVGGVAVEIKYNLKPDQFLSYMIQNEYLDADWNSLVEQGWKK